jgi:hypothetical protein
VGHASDPVLLVLNGVRLKGFADPDALVGITGLGRPDIDAVLADLAGQGLASHRDGRVSGWALTPAGQDEHRQRVAAELEQAGCGAEVEARYQEFLGLNPRLLAAATAWQMRDVNGQAVLNDHADQAHDDRVLAELRQLHDAALPLASALGRLFDRYAHYGPRLSAALARIEAGELDWFTKPLVDSYHTVWFEMHEDLLLTLGRQRSTEEVST